RYRRDHHSFPTRRSSDLAPTFTTATPPASLARRSWSFSRSQSESVSSISRLIWAMRPFTSSSDPPPSTMVVLSLENTTIVEGGRSEEHTSELQSRENLVC